MNQDLFDKINKLPKARIDRIDSVAYTELRDQQLYDKVDAMPMMEFYCYLASLRGYLEHSGVSFSPDRNYAITAKAHVGNEVFTKIISPQSVVGIRDMTVNEWVRRNFSGRDVSDSPNTTTLFGTEEVPARTDND